MQPPQAINLLGSSEISPSSPRHASIDLEQVGAILTIEVEPIGRDKIVFRRTFVDAHAIPEHINRNPSRGEYLAIVSPRDAAQASLVIVRVQYCVRVAISHGPNSNKDKVSPSGKEEEY